jgi:hypothetical protein
MFFSHGVMEIQNIETNKVFKLNGPDDKARATNMTFGIHDKAPDVIILRLVIYQRKSWICIMTYENSDI